MIALSYGITYIWGTVGIILICKYLPKWWGLDAKAAAREYEREHGVASGDVPALSGWTAGGLRAYRLENDAWVGKTLYDLLQAHPEYRVVNLARDGTALGADSGDAAEAGRRRRARRQARGHDREDGPDRPRGLRPGRPRRAAGQGRDPRHQQRAPEEDARGTARPARRRSGPGRRPRALRRADPDRHRYQAAADGHPHGRGREVRGSEVGAAFGRIVRPSTATDLLTLSLGMILGFLIGQFNSRPSAPRWASATPAGSLFRRHRVLDRLAPAVLREYPDGGPQRPGRPRPRRLRRHRRPQCGQLPLSQLTGALALKIFIVGFIACTIPPIIVWAIGYHVFKMNPAVLMGGVAGARSHSGPCREAAVEIQSNVPSIGFPVAYAVSGVLLTVFGYFAMLLAG